jgi:uncharacterized membrane protein YfhO
MAITLQPLSFDLPVERPEISQVVDFKMISPEKVTMTVSTETEALLTLSMPKYPGWKAYINDQQVDIIDVYAGLIGIPMQAGENQEVRLEFGHGSKSPRVRVTLLGPIPTK